MTVEKNNEAIANQNVNLVKYILKLRNILQEYHYASNNKLESVSLYQKVLTELSFVFSKIYSNSFTKDPMHQQKNQYNTIFASYESTYKDIIAGVEKTPISSEKDFRTAALPFIHLASSILADVRDYDPMLLQYDQNNPIKPDYEEFFSLDLMWDNYYSNINNYGAMVDFSIPFIKSDYIKESDFNDKGVYALHKWLKEMYIAFHELNYYDAVDKHHTMALKNIIIKCNNLLGKFFRLDGSDSIKSTQAKFLNSYQEFNSDLSDLSSWDFDTVAGMKNRLASIIVGVLGDLSSQKLFSEDSFNGLFCNSVLSITPDKYINPDFDLVSFSEELTQFAFNPYLISIGLSLLMTSLALGRQVMGTIQNGRMNSKSLKMKLVELKEHNDKLFASKVEDQAVNAVIDNYKQEYKTWIKTEYNEKKDSLFMKDIKDLFTYLYKLDQRLSRDIKKATKQKNFALDPYNKFSDAVDILCFSLNNTLAKDIETAINNLSVYSTGTGDIDNFKKTIMHAKRTIDKFFSIKLPDKVEQYRDKLEEQYKEFLSKVYDKKSGTNSFSDLKEIKKGLEQIGDYAISILKEAKMSNFSEEDEESLDELKNRLLSVEKLADYFFLQQNIEDEILKKTVNTYTEEYKKSKEKIKKALSEENKELVKDTLKELGGIITDLKESVMPYKPVSSFVAFSDMLARRGIIFNFDDAFNKSEVLNTIRLIFKEIPSVETAPELHNTFLQIQTKYFDEPLGVFDPKALGKKIEGKTSYELQQINDVLRSFLKEIRSFNKGISIKALNPTEPLLLNKVPNQINGFRDGRGGRRPYENRENDWNKLERFFVSAGKTLRGNILPVTAAGLGIALTIKKLKSERP